MPHHHRIVWVVLSLILCVSLAVGLATWRLYLTAEAEAGKQLREAVLPLAQLGEAVARFNADYNTGYPGGARQASLGQISNAFAALNRFAHLEAFSLGFELLLAEQQDERIVFLLLHSHPSGGQRALPAPVALDSGLAQPMRLALQGQNGVIRGPDYLGREVLAAYAPIPTLGLGIAAQIDLGALYAPFIQAGLNIILISAVLLGLGAWFITRLLLPLEQDLRNRETRFHELFEHMSSGVAIYRPTPDGQDFCFVDLNPSGQRSSQMPKSAVLGKRVTEVFPGIAKIGLLDVFRRVCQTGQAEYWPAVLYQDQRVSQWVENYVYKLPNGELVAVYDDISQRKQMEEQLRESEARFRLVIDNLPVLIAYCNAEQHFLLANRQYQTWFGLEEQDILGKTAREVLGERAYAVVAPRLETVLAGQAVHYQDRLPTATGWRDYEAQYLPHIEEGKVVGYFVMAEDITARKQLELERDEALAQLQEYAVELELRVSERTQQLEETNHTLQKLAKMKDEFLAGVSHELRSPLNVILTGTEILLENLYGELNPKQHKLIGNIDSSGRHLLSLINDILDVAKIEAGRMELELSQVSPGEICQSCAALMRESATRKGLTLQIDSPGDIPPFQADGRRLKQILLNLLSNAVKFTPRGGEVGLECRLDRENRQIFFTVWDTGIGIAPELTERLFQPFVQLDSRLSRQYEGTGLGLALVKRLADLHGGSIRLESQPAQGSRFTVALPWRPVTAHSEAMDAPAERADAPAGFSGKLLIVEDHAETRALLAEYLEQKGFQVLTASDGSAAISLARAEKPRAILMDIQMPGMDGLEATRYLRLDPALRAIPVIVLTALAMPGDRERCLAAGANAYLSKPVKMPELLRALEDVLSQAGSGPAV